MEDLRVASEMEDLATGPDGHQNRTSLLGPSNQKIHFLSMSVQAVSGILLVR
jgi:hypothetical protein